MAKELDDVKILEINPVKKNDWKTQEMPNDQDVFFLERQFDDKQMARLRLGNIPREMEDKWFWYMEGDTLYAYRSWTGYCIYIIEFSEDHRHKVTVNRDPNQYRVRDNKEDLVLLNKLLDWWSADHYDYYGEWISETVDNLTKAGLTE